MIENAIFTKFYTSKFDKNKPTVVFLHEALGCVSTWRDFPQKVAALTGFNAFAYDRLGHGQSAANLKVRDLDYLHIEAHEVLPSVLAQNNIENPILFGHSDGGTIALLYAAKFTTKAIIAEAAHVLNEAETIEGILKAQTRKDYLIGKLTRHHEGKTNDLWNAWTNSWLQEKFKNWNIEVVLPDISCPSLIIQGKNDEYGTEEQVRRIVKGIGKNAQKWMIPECGHTPHWECPEAVLEHIAKFLL